MQRRTSVSLHFLNRWREEQLVKGVKLTYGDLVKEYIRLNQTDEPFAQIPHGRYINFLSDFLAIFQHCETRSAECYGRAAHA